MRTERADIADYKSGEFKFTLASSRDVAHNRSDLTSVPPAPIIAILLGIPELPVLLPDKNGTAKASCTARQRRFSHIDKGFAVFATRDSKKEQKLYSTKMP